MKKSAYLIENYLADVSKEQFCNNINLRIYRGHKVTKGSRRIRKKRYSFQPKDTVSKIWKEFSAT